jgi:hypothetical protein
MGVRVPSPTEADIVGVLQTVAKSENFKVGHAQHLV